METGSDVARTDPGSRWAFRGYFWDGGWMGVGHGSRVVPPHDHHAVQISLALDGALRARQPDEEWMTAAGVVVLPDVPHMFDPGGRLLAMLFVDPECREGRWLRQSYRQPVNPVPAERFACCVPGLRELWDRPMDAAETTGLVRQVVGNLCMGPPPARKIDQRVTHALKLIRMSDASRIPLAEVAAGVFLSPSRFAHLFSETVGLPFRRYVLWRKLTRALQCVSRGDSLSAAAHASGFSDSAHLTRTFYQMFGLSPTMMLSGGELYEIPAPFEMDLGEGGEPSAG